MARESRRRHGPPALETGDDGLRRAHGLRHLLLRRLGVGPGLDQRSGERKLRIVNLISLLAVWLLHPSLVQLPSFVI